MPKRITKQGFIKRARNKHGKKYDYTLVKYKNNVTNITIVCPEHGPFVTKPIYHLAGSGCPKCPKNAPRSNDKAILYYIKVGALYKIGVTTKTVKDRYNRECVDYKILYQEEGTWEEVNRKEAELIRKYGELRYTGPSPFAYTGTTELFVVDILNKDVRLLPYFHQS